MNNLTNETIRLELGDEYNEALVRSRKYVATAMRRWRHGRATKRQAFQWEGGPAGMLQRCLLFIIEEGNIDDGLSKFGTYLSKEYRQTSNPLLTKDPRYNVTLGEWAEKARGGPNSDAADDALSASPSALLAALYAECDHGGRPCVRSQEELDYFQRFGDTGSAREADRLMGLSRAEGRRIYERVKKRVYRWHPQT